MYLSTLLERVLPPNKMGGPEDDEQEGELMSDQEETQGESMVEREGELEEVTKHWAVRAAASIALLFKVGSIAFAILSVLALTYLGIMISWGLAFGLPWILAYFYFIWICPAHQLSMGIRKCKPHRMMWWVAATFLHIVPITVILTSYTLLPRSLIQQETETNHGTIVLTLSLILAILSFFEITVIYATYIVQRERKRRENLESENSSSAIYNPRSSMNSPPPSYSEVSSDTYTLPPNYEDVVKEEKMMVDNIPI